MPMKNLSPSLKEVAWMPSEGLMVKKTWLMGPRTSSILPMAVCGEAGKLARLGGFE